MTDISNITQFNVDPLSTWRSAFRECVKLSCSEDTESKSRLNSWLTIGQNEKFSEYAKGGASAGQWYGTTYKDDSEALVKINDYDWLEHQFNAHIEQFPPETFK